ncbi:metallopeptidase family protein [Corynebacterium caspium]|uniref:metallopeptidase family protein n=1 Tax=Corynebacterium caspium TaxID=234828 RepID=UPI00035D0705|nr:metallopeptidase family protein [Corynebacterium caspium]WKD59720.1 hypothetical protein CCASP_06705 [Corynebacterium caspium DSM 44850]
MHTRPFRDRHDRGLRGPLLAQQVPRFRSRGQNFDQAVLSAYIPLVQRYPEQLAALDVAVDTIPRMRLSADIAIFPDEIISDGPVPLGRVLAAGVDAHGQPTRARIVIFRMPIEQRVNDAAERAELLKTVVTSLVANYLNIDPHILDPSFDWE